MNVLLNNIEQKQLIALKKKEELDKIPAIKNEENNNRYALVYEAYERGMKEIKEIFIQRLAEKVK